MRSRHGRHRFDGDRNPPTDAGRTRRGAARAARAASAAPNALSLELVLHAGTSLRGAAATRVAFVDRGRADFASPASSTIRSWLLRVGYRASTRPLARSQPRLWLVDPTLQIGAVKLLVSLGCPMSQVPFGDEVDRWFERVWSRSVPWLRQQFVREAKA